MGGRACSTRAIALAIAITGCGTPAASDAGTTSGSTSSTGIVDTTTTTTGAPASSDDGDETSSTSTSTGLATSEGSESASSSTGADPALPEIGPTMGTLPLDFRVSIAGQGSLLVGAIDIADGLGTVEVDDKTLPLVVYERQPWPEQGYTLYQAIAVADDGWTVLWFYCDDTGLSAVYLESTDGIPLQTVFAEGTCEQAQESIDVEVDLPGSEFAILYNGEPFAIEGAEIDIAAAELGSVTLDGVDFIVAPFETVDCSTACGVPGWYEVHVILWDPANLRACFTIVYLETDGAVRLAYGLCLPDLVDPVRQTELDATWSFG